MLPTSGSNPVNDDFLPKDDCWIEKVVYHDVRGDSPSSHFDRDSWPIVQQGQFSSVHNDWKPTHQRMIKVDVFCERRNDFADNSQCFIDSEPQGLKSIFEHATESRVLLRSMPSPGRNYRRLMSEHAKKQSTTHLPFDPLFEDSDVFFPHTEEFSPVNWQGDSFHQGFEI